MVFFLDNDLWGYLGISLLSAKFNFDKNYNHLFKYEIFKQNLNYH